MDVLFKVPVMFKGISCHSYLGNTDSKTGEFFKAGIKFQIGVKLKGYDIDGIAV